MSFDKVHPEVIQDYPVGILHGNDLIFTVGIKALDLIRRDPGQQKDICVSHVYNAGFFLEYAAYVKAALLKEASAAGKPLRAVMIACYKKDRNVKIHADTGYILIVEFKGLLGYYTPVKNIPRDEDSVDLIISYYFQNGIENIPLVIFKTDTAGKCNTQMPVRCMQQLHNATPPKLYYSL